MSADNRMVLVPVDLIEEHRQALADLDKFDQGTETAEGREEYDRRWIRAQRTAARLAMYVAYPTDPTAF